MWQNQPAFVGLRAVVGPRPTAARHQPSRVRWLAEPKLTEQERKPCPGERRLVEAAGVEI
jgi:hypothetical protein